MELTFTDAQPVETNRGRKPDENPFEAAVQGIALKTENGKPKALSTVLTVPKAGKDEVQADVNVRFVNSIIGKLKNAGLKVTPEPVTVYRSIELFDEGKARVTFWTGKKIERKVKAKTEE
jgi:predicted fused transcriptional regulator/phosphomethylpyrimidine kinase